MSDERRVNLIALAENVAVLTEKIDNQNNAVNHLKKESAETKETVNFMKTKLLVDNGGPCIITQFRNNDEMLLKKTTTLERAVNGIKRTIKTIKIGRKSKAEWIKWGVTSLVAISAVMVAAGVFG